MAKGGRGTIAVQSRLRMFLSLDIVGSTEFKQAKRGAEPAEDADSWVEPFLSFYQIAVQQMAAQWAAVREAIAAVGRGDRDGRFELGDGPTFWKGVGDEVLFTKIVRSPVDAAAALHALLGLMREQRRQFAAKPQWQRLNVKGAAWLAGFPINNAEVILPAKDGRPAANALDDPVAENYRLVALRDSAPAKGTAFHADYIGPSIDLGFRLRELADPRRLVVSADLAWLLCHAHRGCDARERAACAYLAMPEVGYEGRTRLRGILGGDPYPLMWVESDPANPLNNAEDRLLRRPPGKARAARQAGALWAFCNAFLTGESPLHMRPYIPGCRVAGLGEMSPDHRLRLAAIQAVVNGRAEQFASLARSDREAGAIPPAAQAFARDILSGMIPGPRGRRRKR
ncbi:hypothetical protein [Enhydrobacter sp.]|jgi:class 3 adenylate cyclase|uniref:hypothetical protein n=1 Tax=Enhydrobacter sp. TaxID=1894999 RepID=UPI002618063D|nr:hypothetical protein [Enhydrobacter sp.]WIM09110.1 MAG: hypothetical protein OJF58_000061 [Enhydrobacter sp.]